MAALSSPNPSLLRRALASPWLRPLNDASAIDDLLGLVRPTLSLTKIRARVVEARRETADARTLVLAPNLHWPGHRAGQHVPVEVEIAGRRHLRTFSLSSAPRPDGLVAITVKRRDGGVVSKWWNDTAAPGAVVTLRQPAGDFVLPDVLPPRIVMVSAGSGITPVLAMLRELDARGAGTRVVFVHCARTPGEAICVGELMAIASRREQVDLRLRFTAVSGRPGDTDWETIAREAGDAPAYVCGPAAFMDAARRAWTARGLAENLRFERFALEPPEEGSAAGGTVVAARSGRTFVAAPGQTLLVAAEAAGLRPKHGCRIGICHTCVCRKVSGTTVDVRDGRISDEPGEIIQLCVNAPRSAVTLEL